MTKNVSITHTRFSGIIPIKLDGVIRSNYFGRR